MTDRRVVVLGEVMLDVVAVHDAPLAIASDTPARIRLRPGGAGANTAAWLARAGVEVALVARVGDDDAAKAALGAMDAVDLRVSVDASLPTGTCIVLVAPGGERTMLPDPGANTALSSDDLPEDLFVEGSILHVSGYSLMRPGSRPAALTAMDRARDAGMLISVDPASAALLIDDPAFLHRARPVDLLLPNADELAALGGDLPGVKEFAVKLGRDGARWSDGARNVAVPAVRVEEVVDTTGAGDAFAAGFLSVWPGDRRLALEAGARLAAQAVAQEGGRPAGGAR
ncbi:sugar kinase [Solirubrobacter ginsenosidimutans]|uniref:Sugar kinase n=1 Tax=Solirubrobacter ginsenosidimutans TaxID=490573 RepID=A0A9X3MYX2_9ACTN|nr:sugar kinase [Solirubrobacter ginsenosidimutans]MDA0165399.1 sugar kinase [Solirubrobacter ginsenosidimutans]